MSIVVPSSEADRQKIRQGVEEISNSLTRIAAERDLIKEVLSNLEDAVGIKKKYLRQMAKFYHKQNLTEVSSEFDDIESLYESTMKRG